MFLEMGRRCRSEKSLQKSLLRNHLLHKVDIPSVVILVDLWCFIFDLSDDFYLKSRLTEVCFNRRIVLTLTEICFNFSVSEEWRREAEEGGCEVLWNELVVYMSSGTRQWIYRPGVLVWCLSWSPTCMTNPFDHLETGWEGRCPCTGLQETNIQNIVIFWGQRYKDLVYEKFCKSTYD